jgi:hypothetical protein
MGGEGDGDVVPRQRAGGLLGPADQGLDVAVGPAGDDLGGEPGCGVAGAQRLDGPVGRLVVLVVEGGHGERMPAQRVEGGVAEWLTCAWRARRSSAGTSSPTS